MRGIAHTFALAVISALKSMRPQRRSPHRSTMYQPSRRRYMPHQGERECARRLRQLAKKARVI